MLVVRKEPRRRELPANLRFICDWEKKMMFR